MNLDELMAVWRTQDAAPLHDVNKTLLHLALRQEEAQLQKKRRIERWVSYVASAGVVAAMALFLALLIHARDRSAMTGWDYVIGIGGAAAALLTGGVMYAGHRSQTRREQHFGESLRDQLSRRIAQLDDPTTIYRETLVMVLLGGICPVAIIFFGYRVNQKALSEGGYMLIGLLIWLVGCVAAGIWEVLRQVRDVVLPRKRRLEALLQELDRQ
jgi:hypothetical protein